MHIAISHHGCAHFAHTPHVEVVPHLFFGLQFIAISHDGLTLEEILSATVAQLGVGCITLFITLFITLSVSSGQAASRCTSHSTAHCTSHCTYTVSQLGVGCITLFITLYITLSASSG